MRPAFLINAILLTLLLAGTTANGSTEQEIRDAYYKSYSYEKLQDYENAINSLSTIVRDYPQGYTVNLRLGWLYYLKRNYANSIHYYKQAIKAKPHALEAKLGYSYPLLAQRKYEEVESVLYRILSIDHYNYYANLKLVYALRMQKKYDLAEKISKDMLALYPIDVLFLTELALTKDGQKEARAAAGIFWNILILDPENPAANSYLQQPAPAPGAE